MEWVPLYAIAWSRVCGGLLGAYMLLTSYEYGLDRWLIGAMISIQ